VTPLELYALSGQVAKAYRKRCRWADFDDMRQEAAMAMLSAHRCYLTHPEGDERGYLYMAATYAVKAYLLRASSPVSASRRRADNLRGLRGTGLQVLESGVRSWSQHGPGSKIRDLPPAHQPLVLRMSEEAWLERARRELARVFAEVPAGDTIARRVLLEGERATVVAADCNLPARDVLALVARVRRAIVNDAHLYTILRERVE